MNNERAIHNLKLEIETLRDSEAVFSDIQETNLRNLTGQTNYGIIHARETVASFASDQALYARINLKLKLKKLAALEGQA